MPSPFLKNDKPEKPAKPEKPEAKEKSGPIPSVPLEFMPSAIKHPNRLVAVTNKDGGFRCIAFSNGVEWLTLHISGALHLPPDQDDDDDDRPEPPLLEIDRPIL